MKIFLLKVLYFASIVSADTWRFSVPKFNVIETREWTTDHLNAKLNIVVGGPSGQNITKDLNFGQSSAFSEGSSYAVPNFWQDTSLTGNEPNLTFTFALYNVGDKEPQEIGLKIASLVLQIPKRIPAAGLISYAIDEFIGLFQGSYRCEGPVAVVGRVFNQKDLLAMPVGRETCDTRLYQYRTQKGCVDVNPTTTKMTNYSLTYCIQRRSGNSSGDGYVHDVAQNGGNTRLHEKLSAGFYVFAISLVMLFMGSL